MPPGLAEARARAWAGRKTSAPIGDSLLFHATGPPRVRADRKRWLDRAVARGCQGTCTAPFDTAVPLNVSLR